MGRTGGLPGAGASQVIVEDVQVEPPDTTSSEEGSGCETTEESSSEPSEAQRQEGVFARSQRRACVGFCSQYFAVGLIYGGIPATTYGVFLGYLNVPGYVYATASVVSMLPWSFKFLFGLCNDTMPIMGLRRKPYMCLGWGLCAAALAMLSRMPLPDPYWCIDPATGAYIREQRLPDGSREAADPCNPDAAKAGGKYAMMLMLAALGYVIADVAADGLTTEYARVEPLERRGTTQTTAYITRTLGSATATLFVGFCMNSKLYNGTFDWGLSFETICLCLSVPAMLMVPISGLLVREPKRSKTHTCVEYLGMCWELLQSKACFCVILYFFLSGSSNLGTTAMPQVKRNWAGVHNLQNQLFSLVGGLLFALGLYIVKRHFLNSSWRLMLAAPSVFLILVDCFFMTLTIFDIVRNQYFYLGETVIVEVPDAAKFVVSTFVIVELADEGNEGLVYGLLTTSMNLGSPLSRALGNQLFSLFHPSLSDHANYIRDEPSFRVTVFSSVLLTYAFMLAALSLLMLLPNQKEEAQRRKREWSRRPAFGVATLVMLGCGFTYSLTANFMSMFPSTLCLRFAGGSGCED